MCQQLRQGADRCGTEAAHVRWVATAFLLTRDVLAAAQMRRSRQGRICPRQVGLQPASIIVPDGVYLFASVLCTHQPDDGQRVKRCETAVVWLYQLAVVGGLYGEWRCASSYAKAHVAAGQKLPMSGGLLAVQTQPQSGSGYEGVSTQACVEGHSVRYVVGRKHLT
jgi:hypothetical protein